MIKLFNFIKEVVFMSRFIYTGYKYEFDSIPDPSTDYFQSYFYWLNLLNSGYAVEFKIGNDSYYLPTGKSFDRYVVEEMTYLAQSLCNTFNIKGKIINTDLFENYFLQFDSPDELYTDLVNKARSGKAHGCNFSLVYDPDNNACWCRLFINGQEESFVYNPYVWLRSINSCNYGGAHSIGPLYWCAMYPETKELYDKKVANDSASLAVSQVPFSLSENNASNETVLKCIVRENNNSCWEDYYTKNVSDGRQFIQKIMINGYEYAIPCLSAVSMGRFSFNHKEFQRNDLFWLLYTIYAGKEIPKSLDALPRTIDQCTMEIKFTNPEVVREYSSVEEFTSAYPDDFRDIFELRDKLKDELESKNKKDEDTYKEIIESTSEEGPSNKYKENFSYAWGQAMFTIFSGKIYSSSCPEDAERALFYMLQDYESEGKTITESSFEHASDILSFASYGFYKRMTSF